MGPDVIKTAQILILFVKIGGKETNTSTDVCTASHIFINQTCSYYI